MCVAAGTLPPWQVQWLQETLSEERATLGQTEGSVAAAPIWREIEAVFGQAYPASGNTLTLGFVTTDTGWRIAHARNTTINRAVAAVAYVGACPLGRASALLSKFGVFMWEMWPDRC
jgi:hypothetical protein